MGVSKTEPQVSNVSLKSNVYRVAEGAPHSDKAFLDAIHDPELLQLFDRRFKGRHRLSALQNEELTYAIRCMYAEEDDYPWGTVQTETGAKKVVCKCENRTCALFAECRPEAPAFEHRAAPGGANPDEKFALDVPNAKIEAFNEAFYGSREPSRPVAKEEEGERLDDVTRLQAEAASEFDESLGFGPEVSKSAETDGASGNFGCEPVEVFPDPHLAEQEIRNVDAPCEDVGGGRPALTDEQRAIVALPRNCRTLVNAGPGTGKTFVLVERIIHMLQNQDVPADEILILSFSRAAVSVIESRLSSAEHDGRLSVPWRSLEVRTFDSFATWMLYRGAEIKPDRVPESFLLTGKQISGLDYDQRIQAAKNLAEYWTGLFDNVSHVFVDETQDLVSPRSDLVLEILQALPDSCGFTLLGDGCQAIYNYRLKKNGDAVGKGMSSGDMIGILRKSLGPVECALTANHRVKRPLPYSLDELRTALVAEDDRAARDALRNILDAYPDEAKEMRDIDKRDVEDATAHGSLGILFRQNGEALYTSTLLRDKSAAHFLRRSNRSEFISRTVADVFFDYENDSIDRREFVARAVAAGAGSEERCTDAWYNLTEACADAAMGSRYRVEDLLNRLATDAGRSSFFADAPSACDVHISTIHTAKGREYDTVWLDADDLEEIAKKGDIDECRIAYVALSRPAKSLGLVRAKARNSVKRRKDPTSGEQRCFKVSKRRGDVCGIEVLNEVDIDFNSFGDDGAAQRILREGCAPGSPLVLRKARASSSDYPTYEICLLDENECCNPLGIVKNSFGRAFAESQTKAGGTSRGAGKCPCAFDNLYVETVVTCVGDASDAPSCAKRFGIRSIWYGMTVTGLAAADNHGF